MKVEINKKDTEGKLIVIDNVENIDYMFYYCSALKSVTEISGNASELRMLR